MKQPEKSIRIPINGLAMVDATDTVGDMAEIKWPNETEALVHKTRVNVVRKKLFSELFISAIQ